MGPMLSTNIAGLAFKFLFSSGASGEKLVASMTCYNVEIVKHTSVSHFAFTTTQPPLLGSKTLTKLEHN